MWVPESYPHTQYNPIARVEYRYFDLGILDFLGSLPRIFVVRRRDFAGLARIGEWAQGRFLKMAQNFSFQIRDPEFGFWRKLLLTFWPILRDVCSCQIWFSRRRTFILEDSKRSLGDLSRSSKISSSQRVIDFPWPFLSNWEVQAWCVPFAQTSGTKILDPL